MISEMSNLLDQVDSERGRSEPPATTADIIHVSDYLRAEFDLSLPKVWSDLWHRTDGVVWNGMSLYRAGPGRKTANAFIDSFIAVNQAFKETSRGNYVFYGFADDVAAYVYHIPSRTWQDVNPIGQGNRDVYETYQTPEEMIVAVLTQYLNQ